MTVDIRIGDCTVAMRDIPPGSIDACVTDPPYHLTSIVKRFGKSQLEHSDTKDLSKVNASNYRRLAAGFMGKQWDGGDVAFRPETWRLVWEALKPGAHLLAFSGTRTYHRMVCAIEDAGFEIRDQIGWLYGSGFPKSHNAGNGWGTALKPAWEPIVLARKRLVGTVAANVLQHGTGAINIDGCRIGTESTLVERPRNSLGRMNDDGWQPKEGVNGSENGRWPANVIHDGSEEVLRAFPDGRSAGNYPSDSEDTGTGVTYRPTKPQGALYEDSGSAARFFYTAKADAADRLQSKHPTVKPVDLIAYLCRLITPPGGTVLDCFAGSGTTGMACMREGFNAILIEREAEYVADIKRRIAHVQGLDAPLFAEAAQ